MPVSRKDHYTYADYLATPEELSRRYEIIDGELFVTEAPTLDHQFVLTQLACEAFGVALENGLGKVVIGPVGVRLENDTVMTPDMIFVRADRLHIIDWDRDVMGAPDLVAEVLSPTRREYERDLKRQRYLKAGVPEVWIVDTELETIEIWRRDAFPHTVETRSIEWRVGEQTFEIPLAKIFRR